MEPAPPQPDPGRGRRARARHVRRARRVQRAACDSRRPSRRDSQRPSWRDSRGSRWLLASTGLMLLVVAIIMMACGAQPSRAATVRPAGSSIRLRLLVPEGRYQAGTVNWTATPGHAHTGAPVLRGASPWPVLLYSPGAGDDRTFGTVREENPASRGALPANHHKRDRGFPFAEHARLPTMSR
jgi:hypothetical protein